MEEGAEGLRRQWEEAVPRAGFWRSSLSLGMPDSLYGHQTNKTTNIVLLDEQSGCWGSDHHLRTVLRRQWCKFWFFSWL